MMKTNAKRCQIYSIGRHSVSIFYDRRYQVHDAEPWAMKKAENKKLDVAEMSRDVRMDDWSHQAGQNLE